MGALVQDARYAFRWLARNPGFAAVAILTLGLGIGTVTTIFSILDAAVLRPLPYRDPDALMTVAITHREGSRGAGDLSLVLAEVREPAAARARPSTPSPRTRASTST